MSIYLRRREEGLPAGAEIAWTEIADFNEAHTAASLRRRRINEKAPDSRIKVGLWRAPKGWIVWEAK